MLEFRVYLRSCECTTTAKSLCNISLKTSIPCIICTSLGRQSTQLVCIVERIQHILVMQHARVFAKLHEVASW
jgi:recombinational DNA repair protein RecR